MESKTKKLISTISAAALAALVTVGPAIAVNIVYERAFGRRINTYQPLSFSVNDFAGLKRDRHVFASNNGQKLIGYMYYHEGIEQNAVIILAHGYGGGGQRTYMDCTNYLCSKGFYVFAYDATGNDESEGQGIGGFPQGIIDVNHAIDYVESLEKYRQYPLMLFGHSWGAYSVSNALQYHPEIKAAVAISGFNKSSSLILSHGHRYGGPTADNVIPYIENYEKSLFGKYADSTSIKSFENSQAKIFLVQSGDDDVVPYDAGFEIYYKQFKNNDRFTFLLYENRGHGTVYYTDEAVRYTKKFETSWDKFLRQNPSEEQKQQFINNNLNRSYWNNRIDNKLFDKIVAFYNENI